MSSEFDNQLGLQGVDALDLPLAHTTTFEISRQILESGQFASPNPCPVYNEDLFYTFVARPVYRFPDTPNPVMGLAFAPVCFLLQPTCAEGAKRALPFDSGGFERYRDQMHPAWQRSEFEMLPARERSRQVLDYFWDTNSKYYSGNPKTNLEIPAVKTLLQQYQHLITNGVTHGFDTRCSTIEVQLSSPLDLDGQLLAVFAPIRAADDPTFKALVSQWSADLIPYRYHEPFYKNDYFTPIFDAVELYLQRNSNL